MALLSKIYGNYIYLVVLIWLQLVANSSALKCVKCGGSEAKCGNTLDAQIVECPTNATYRKCFTQIDTSGDIIRGCRKEGDEDSCVPKNNCILSDEGKNMQLVCKQCDGSDQKCSQTDVSDGKYNKICENNEKNCIVKVDNKLVVRGCADNVDECTAEKFCQSCTTSICNAGIFPKDRLKCYQCTGSGCNDLKVEDSLACQKLEKEDACYSLGNSETNMSRGCKSDATENKCSPIVEGCVFCNKSDCNNLPYKRDQKLQCHQCKGDKTHGECFQAQTSQTFNKCEKQILYNQTEKCYTRYVGDTVERGCFNDNTALTDENCNNGSCKTCTQDGCNKEKVEFTCIRCRSDINQKCWNNAKDFKGERCRNESTTAADGCFSGVWNDVAIRGCVADATIQTQSVCLDKTNPQCTVCHTNDCNTKRSSGTKNILSYTLILMVCLTLWELK